MGADNRGVVREKSMLSNMKNAISTLSTYLMYNSSRHAGIWLERRVNGWMRTYTDKQTDG